MIVISSRDFRANQGKYFDMANNGESVIVKSQRRGSFKIVPVANDDSVYNKEELSAMVSRSLHQIKNGECFTMNDDESGEDFLNRMLCIK